VNSTKAMLTIGFVFLAAGVLFLAVGLSTHILAFSVLGPSLIGLGTFFVVTSKVREKKTVDQGARLGDSRSEV
jgi:UPF0716 family protein affecting phage T7 exclusion